MRQKIPQLDAVRGLAILLVMAHNTSLDFPSYHSRFIFANGWMGVDLFFVLSGFLISGILLDSKRSPGYFKNFYVRRCLRIWPLYFSLILFMFVGVRLLSPAEGYQVISQSAPWWAYLLFLQNFLMVASTNAAGPLGVTWSVAIEEQFYLVWPFIARFLNSTRLRWLAVTEICLSPLWRHYMSLHQVHLYTNVFCRLDGLMAGALLALFVRERGFAASKYLTYAWIGLLVAVPLAFLAQAFGMTSIVYSFTALASVSFIYLSLYSPQRWLQAIMNNRFLVYTGTISYGLYLLHKISFGAVKTLHLDRNPYLPWIVAFLLSYALAVISWNVLEKPFLRLKRYFEFQPFPAALSKEPVGSQSGRGEPI
jgi:peptidoglycan/LPS O-acetylase OafA/YrhL